MYFRSCDVPWSGGFPVFRRLPAQRWLGVRLPYHVSTEGYTEIGSEMGFFQVRVQGGRERGVSPWI